MTDLRSLLEQATPPAAPVSPSVVDADLARAQRGLRRRRALQGTRSGVLAVAACAAAVLTVQHGLPAGTGPGSTTSGPSASQQAPAIGLVAYTGPRITGFSIDRVPVGWVVEGVDTGALTLVPAGQQDPDGYRRRTTSGVRAFQGRIAVFRSDRLPERSGTAVHVDGSDGLVVALDHSTAGDHLGGYSLFLPQDVKGYLTVQVPAELGWSVQQLVEFGGGIHMTDSALKTAG